MNSNLRLMDQIGNLEMIQASLNRDEIQDVIIVGGGPAGSSLAYRLAKKGIKVTLFEKTKFPRVKPCGGGIDSTFFDYLPEGLDVSEFVQDWASSILLRYEGSKEQKFSMPQKVGMVERAPFDQYLLNAAKLAGVKVRENTGVDEIFVNTNGVYEIITGSITTKAQVVVGADGAYSVVARKTGMRTPRTIFVASEWDLYMPKSIIKSWKGKMLLDCSVNPVGYAWVFPKKEFLNIGFGLPFKDAKSVHQLTEKFAKKLGFDLSYGFKKRAHWIPFARRNSEAVSKGVVLIGDAAGVADPATGAGISWALRSSAMASKWIIHAIESNSLEWLKGYQDEYEKLLNEVEAAMSLRNLFVITLVLIRKIPVKFFQPILEISSGVYSYTDWKNKNPFAYKLGKLMAVLVNRKIQ